MADPGNPQADHTATAEDHPAAGDGAHAAAPVSLGVAALGLLQHRAAPVAVLLTGGLLAWLGSQWPQRFAPLLAADGLARLDALTLAELGFDRLLTSLPLVLWLITAVAVAAVRWRAAASAQGMATQALWATSAVAAAAAMFTAPTAAPVIVDLPIEPGAAPVQGWSADAGRLAPTAGSWTGQCTLAGSAADQLSCRLEGQGRSWLVELAPGRPSRQDGFQWTWLSSGPALGSRVWDATWPATAGAAPALVRLQADRAVDVPPLATRLMPVSTRSTGPLILALPDKGPAQLWTAATLAPKVAPSALVRTAPTVRLQLAAVAPSGGMWLLALLAAAAAVALSPLPALKRRQP